MSRLDGFLTEKGCQASVEEQLSEALWGAAAPDERLPLARLLLKVSDRL